MPELKLAKLPDRTPTKITFTASAELNHGLGRYAEMYRAAYGEAEPVAELIPFMLEAFLESDREFAKALKSGGYATPVTPAAKSQRHEPPAMPSALAKET